MLRNAIACMAAVSFASLAACSLAPADEGTMEDVGAVSDALSTWSWRSGPTTDPSVPDGAVFVDTETGRTMYVCRGIWNNSLFPGKAFYYGRWYCNIGYSGREIGLTSFELLIDPDHTLSWSSRQNWNTALVGASTNQFVCRAPYGAAKHSGRLVSGKCHFGYGSVELTSTSYELLHKPAVTGGCICPRPDKPCPCRDRGL